MDYHASISRRALLATLGALPAARLLRGQKTQPAYSADVKVVNLFATVHNKLGQAVKDLTHDDFLLDEEGRPQVIKYFSQETNLPLTLGLLVDTSGSQRGVIGEERVASFRFLDKLMRQEMDMAFVIHFDFEVELLQDLTTNKDTLRKSLDLLEIGDGRQQLGRRQPGGRGGGGRGRGGGGTDLYDAVYLGADEIMRKQKGRKAMIILSDGVDTGSKLTLISAVESAQRSDTLVFGILFSDPDSYGFAGFGGMGRRGRGGPPMDDVDGKKVLQQISRETGGRFFEVSKRMPIDKVYDAIEQDLRSQYSIGYTSDSPDKGTEYRRIHLTTKQKGLVVQAREGYYPS